MSRLLDALEGLPATRIVYTDVDNTLVGSNGSLLTDADGTPDPSAAVALTEAAAAGITVVPVSGRAMPLLRNDVRLMGLADCIGEAGAVILRGGEQLYEWGACPRDLAPNPHDAMTAAGAVAALLEAFVGDLRHYEPWHKGREGGHLFHGLVDTAAADALLAEAGCEWAYLRDNGSTGGWEGRDVRAYHLLPRGVGKAQAVDDDLRARGLESHHAVAVGDSLEDFTMAPHVGAFFLVANGHAPPDTEVIRTPRAVGGGFADVIDAVLAHGDRAEPT